MIGDKASNTDTAAADMMAVALARLLVPGETVFHGLASPLPAVAIRLARELGSPGPVYLNLAGGVDASPARQSLSTCGPEYFAGASSVFPLADVFDLAARGGLDTVFLSAVQIDARGRLNSSVIGDFSSPRIRFPGGAGAAVLAPNARRTLVWRTKHDLRSFVGKLDFVTAAGRVEKVVTPLAVFRAGPGGLELESVHPGHTVEEVRAATGFPVSDAPPTPPPTARELAALARVDPGFLRRAEF